MARIRQELVRLQEYRDVGIHVTDQVKCGYNWYFNHVFFFCMTGNITYFMTYLTPSSCYDYWVWSHGTSDKSWPSFLYRLRNCGHVPFWVDGLCPWCLDEKLCSFTLWARLEGMLTLHQARLCVSVFAKITRLVVFDGRLYQPINLDIRVSIRHWRLCCFCAYSIDHFHVYWGLDIFWVFLLLCNNVDDNWVWRLYTC